MIDFPQIETLIFFFLTITADVVSFVFPAPTRKRTEKCIKKCIAINGYVLYTWLQ